MSIRRVLERYIPSIERELKEFLDSPHELLFPFYGMMRYHLGWVDESFSSVEGKAGKRIRPVICLLSCEASGGEAKRALPAACAVELIHNFSLVHDDIEDESPIRRHRPSVWKIWGIPHAINVGDGLFAIAYSSIHRLEERGVQKELVFEASKALAETCVALSQGQYLDMSFEKRLDIGVEQYLFMIKKKTGALFSCSAKLGAILAGAEEEVVSHYSSFGEYFGLAFQIVDDILGIWGREDFTGKPVADDIRSRKKTLPIVYALEREGTLKRSLIEIYRKEEIGGGDVEEVLAILDEIGARQYAEGVAIRYHRLALEELASTGIENESQDSLRELSQFIIGRINQS